MNWIKRLFKKTQVYKSQAFIPPPPPPSPTSEWIELEKQKPPHEVVLAACDTYDCGWILNTAWWNEKDGCWMTTGGIQSEEAHLPYSHWRKLPSNPDGQ
jgi:hypothetical protein